MQVPRQQLLLEQAPPHLHKQPAACLWAQTGLSKGCCCCSWCLLPRRQQQGRPLLHLVLQKHLAWCRPCWLLARPRKGCRAAPQLAARLLVEGTRAQRCLPSWPGSLAARAACCRRCRCFAGTPPACPSSTCAACCLHASATAAQRRQCPPSCAAVHKWRGLRLMRQRRRRRAPARAAPPAALPCLPSWLWGSP